MTTVPVKDSGIPILATWPDRIKWPTFHILITIPVLGFIAAMFTPLLKQTAALAIVYFCFVELGVTAGYHRLWSHRSYSATFPLRLVLAIMGAGAMQGSIEWWVRGHRAHHRYTDTEKDPYNIKQGFLHAHIMWLIARNNNDNGSHVDVDISDIKRDPIVAWQERYYVPLAFLMGWATPTLIAGYGWGDFVGGFVYAAIIRMFFNHQVAFCTNSVAHYFGSKTYDDRLSPRDNLYLVPFTLGEGYHNFHHEFPTDYRNGVEWYHLDVTKWVIYMCSIFGLATRLNRSPKDDVRKGSLAQEMKRAQERQAMLDWGTPIEDLPVMVWEEFVEEANSGGMSLVAIEGIVYDVTEFVDEHPGGREILLAHQGRDATAAFNGGVYFHSTAARNRMAAFRRAVIARG